MNQISLGNDKAVSYYAKFIIVAYVLLGFFEKIHAIVDTILILDGLLTFFGMIFVFIWFFDKRRFPCNEGSVSLLIFTFFILFSSLVGGSSMARFSVSGFAIVETWALVLALVEVKRDIHDIFLYLSLFAVLFSLVYSIFSLVEGIENSEVRVSGLSDQSNSLGVMAAISIILCMVNIRKWGKIAATIAAGEIVEVRFMLHGSFAKTYKGHGTDKALVAGILGFNPWDEELKESFDIAKSRNIKFSFEEVTMEDVHPNTVKFIIEKSDNSISTITGSSIGGGNVIVTEINGMKIEFTGEYPTLIINHKDRPGMVSKVSTILSDNNINIAFLKVYRSRKGKNASMIFEVDNVIKEDIVYKIKDTEDIESVTVINPIKEG